MIIHLAGRPVRSGIVHVKDLTSNAVSDDGSASSGMVRVKDLEFFCLDPE